MNIRDKQICEKLLAEIAVADELLNGFLRNHLHRMKEPPVLSA